MPFHVLPRKSSGLARLLITRKAKAQASPNHPRTEKGGIPMEKKILLAVDDSIHSKHAVEYAVRMSSVVKDLTYTLFHVQPAVSGFLLDEAKTSLRARAELRKVIRKNTGHAEKILKKYKGQMVRMGISDERIDLATQPKTLGVAKDVLEWAEQGLYDAIVMGRRGLSRVQEAFMGSVTADVVEHSRFIPVWVVDGNVTSTNIMVAVDGSESSLHAVDHLSFMVAGNPGVKVTLFHVVPTFGPYSAIDFANKGAANDQLVEEGKGPHMNGFCEDAQKKFREAGIHDDQIETKVRRCTLNVSKSIIEEARKGNYGTVVVGRRGINGAFFMGSVSRHVLDSTSNRTLWLVSNGTGRGA